MEGAPFLGQSFQFIVTQSVTAGVVVSIEEIQSTVAEVLKENMEAILEQRYHINGLVSSSLLYY